MKPSHTSQIATPAAARSATRPRPIVDNPWAILAILFLVAGVLGVPLLWISRAFSPLMKIVWSVVVTVYTAAALYGTWLVLVWCWTSIEKWQ
jgi:hypothetical protein